VAAGKGLAVVSHPALSAGIRCLLFHLDEFGIAASNRRNRMGTARYSTVANVRTQSEDARLSRFEATALDVVFINCSQTLYAEFAIRWKNRG
jgi:hypothetical protein